MLPAVARPGRPGPEEAAALLARVRAGDPSARKALFEAWIPVVLQWCANLGGPRVDVEDAAHDVMVTALGRLHTLRRPGSFDSWMFGVTRRVLRGHRRRGWLLRWVPGRSTELADPAEGAAALLERDQLASQVRAVLARMPEDLREVLVLCDIEERRDEEAASLLDLPLGTLKSRLRRARERFRVEARRHAPDLVDGGAP